MSPARYLVRILTKPTKVDEATWQKWYIEKHVPDVVKSGFAIRGGLFRAHNDMVFQSKTPVNPTEPNDPSKFSEGPADKTFCAVYQTKLEKPYESDEIKTIPTTSELLPDGGPMFVCAEWDMRVYELIQDYDPDNLGDVLSPFALHVQHEPSNEAEYNVLDETEYLDKLHKVPGHRRTQRYRLLEKKADAPENTPHFIAIHEFEHLDALDGPEMSAIDYKTWHQKAFGSPKGGNVRGFECVTSKGYANS